MGNSSEGYGLVSNDQFVGKLVQKYLFPSICALLGIQASGFINSIIIGRILGGVGLGVVSLVAPISLVYFSIGSLIGVGSSIVSSIALGKGAKDYCRQVYTQAYLITLGAGIILTAAGLLNLERIVLLLGAREEHFRYTYEYVRNYIMGGIGMLLVYIPLNYLRITGKPRMAMIMLLFMSVFHIIGLWIFVILLNLGVGGTALASVTSGILTFFVGAGMLRDKHSVLRFRRPAAPGKQFIALVSAGSPSALNNICQAVQIFSINLLFVRTGIGMFLPSYSLVFTISEVILAVILGISQTALPLVGISFGERDFRSIRIVMKKAMGIGNIIVGGCALLLLVIHRQLGGLFGLQDPQILRQTGIGFIFLAASLNLSFLNNVIMNYFSATGQTALANIIVISRMVVFMVLPAYALFPLLNIYSVWAGLILAELITMAMVYLLITKKHARNPRLSRYLLLDESLMENSKVIDFSVRNTSDDVASAADKITGFCEENEVPPQKAMRISLAIEEMIVMINQYSLKEGETEYTDVRLMIIGERIVMRIRNLGKYFNPVAYYYDNKDTEEGRERTIGVAMILRMAQKTEYQETFGVNNLLITI
ncbi:MAG: ATP-binding protein [Spirochaetaceae bacterium]|jgi:Na+-driven multidrug efflux pump/anti-sigma regulatory factor (Ser/Thr protein kinase)|nr:ATP-binding protein [Spirochaetaceae bacterium]